MIWMIAGAALAAAGLLLFVWAAFGWCVCPPRHDAETIYRLQADEPQLERQVQAFVWSRKSGLAGGRLVLLGGQESAGTAALAAKLAAQYGCVEYRPSEEGQGST